MIKIMTRIARDWAVRCFGAKHVTDRRVRAQRFLEEAIELTQAVGLDRDDSIAIVDMVYSRPTGDVYQEAGGTMLTLCILLETIELDPDDVMEAELRRVLAKTPEYFKKRNDDKINLLREEER